MIKNKKSPSSPNIVLPKPALSKDQIESLNERFIKSKKCLSFLLEHSQGLIVLFNENKQVFYTNPITMKRNLFPPDLLMGQSLEKIIEFSKKIGNEVLTKQVEVVINSLEKVDIQGVAKNVQIQLANMSGGIHNVICDIGKIEDENDSFYAMVGLDVSDRTTLKAVNKQLLSPSGLPGRLMENSSDVICLLNKDCMVQFVNGSIEHLFGLSVEEIIGHSFLEFVDQDDRKKVTEAFSLIKKKEKNSTSFKYRAKKPTGEMRYFESIVTNFLNNPVINGIIVNTRDISEQVFSQEKYKMTLNSINDLIFTVDNKLNVVLTNDRYLVWAKRFKWTKNPLGKRIDNVINIKDSSVSEYVSVTKLKKRIVSEYEYEYDGEKFFFSVSKNPIIQDEELVGILVVISDETDKRLEEIKRKATEDYLKNVIDESNNLIFMIDAVGNIAFWNKEAEDVTGVNSSKIVGRHFSSVDVFSKDTTLRRYLDSISQGFEDSIDEMFLRCSEGNIRHFKMKAIPLKGVSKDELMGIIFMAREFTSIGKRSGRLNKGDCVYVVDKNWKDSFNLVGDFVSDSKKGLVVTRKEKSKMIKINQFGCTALLLGDEVGLGGDSDSLQRVSDKIEEFVSKNSNAIVLLDRVDYLISLFSFSEVMSLLYRLCSIIRSNEAVLVVRLNREIVDENEFALLVEELNSLPGEKIGSIEIDKTNLNILKLIMLKNDTNIAISFKDVGRELGISKVTVSKRIGMLLDFGLIVVNRKGKSKHIYITRKGKRFLEQRMVD